MESAAVDVEVDIPAVEIRGTGFPYFYLRMHRLYGFPDGLADTFALNTHLHIEECKLTYGLPLSRLGRADASVLGLQLTSSFYCFLFAKVLIIPHFFVYLQPYLG